MLIKLQKNVLDMVARGESREALLASLCSGVEALLPGTAACILLIDQQGKKHLVTAPNLPENDRLSLEKLVSERFLVDEHPGTLEEQVVVVADIALEQFENMTRLSTLPPDYFCCPILSGAGKALGILLLCLKELRGPTPLEQAIVEGCSAIASLALERDERELELARITYTDLLTGLANRMQFNRRLNERIAADTVLVVADIDNLRSINDTFGYSAGDELIAAVAARLQEKLGPVPVYRIGGGNFAFVLNSVKLDHVADVVQDIINTMSIGFVCDRHRIIPSLTMGMNSARSDDQPAADLQKGADLALSHAKNRRRGQYLVYDHTLLETELRRANAVKSLAAALQEDRVEAWYQPIVRLDTEEIVGVEALARIIKPNGEVISAAAFHEATNEPSTATALTQRMIDCTARDIRHWLDIGIPFQHAGLNVSGADLALNEFPGTLVAAFQRQDVPLHHVVLEVTESVCIGDSDPHIINKIQSLRSAGFKVALDDFGTGFASLTHLISVPIDIIKIDRSFIQLLAPGAAGAAIVEGVLHIAKGLNIRVVAEGVETRQQAEALEARGCRLAQGYLYSKPVSARAMSSLLLSRAQARAT
jgi:diguanylate cyclase (GGDEF)-like protein